MDPVFEAAIVERVQRGDVRVPAYPRAATQLSQVLAQPDFSLDEVVKVLRGDDVLAGTALRVANSAFYSRGEPVNTLSAAVMRVGAKELHRLVLASGLEQAFSSTGPLATLRRRAWRQSLLSATICERLATVAGEPPEESFVAGLLHDVGKVLAIAVIEQLLGERPGVCLPEEQWWEVVERFHVELGMVIAARWKLPAALEAVICDHHAVEGTEATPVLRRVQAADEVVQLLEAEASLTEERLGSVAVLSTAECRALAVTIPKMPEFIAAFSHDAPAEPRSSAVARLSPHVDLSKMDRPLEVELHASGTVLKGHLVDLAVAEFIVRTSAAGRPNWLVQLKLTQSPELCFWANVKGSESTDGGQFDWTLKPFALAPAMARAWAELSKALSKAA